MLHYHRRALVQFENTPKAFANLSPGFERSENPGVTSTKVVPTLKGFGDWRTLSGFIHSLECDPRVVAGAPTLGWG